MNADISEIIKVGSLASYAAQVSYANVSRPQTPMAPKFVWRPLYHILNFRLGGALQLAASTPPSVFCFP